MFPGSPPRYSPLEGESQKPSRQATADAVGGRPCHDDNSVDGVGHDNEFVHFDGWEPIRNSISMTMAMAVFAGAVHEPPHPHQFKS